MVLNEAVQTLREAEELKQKISKFKTGASMLQERSLWTTQQQLQNLYQKLLVLDLDYALDKKVEQDLWNVGFKQQIEALQTISKDRKNAHRSDGQQMLSWVLQAAAGFYLCLLHQICTAFRLDLPFRRRASLLGLVKMWGAGGGDVRTPPPAAALYICQHCLVHLGDLARYRQQLRVAHSFYRHALLVSAHSGQPYNQLALVSWRRGRRLGALYWHVRSLLVRAPFPPAPANLSRTLAAAAAAPNTKTEELPVLPGVIEKSPAAPSKLPVRLTVTAHTFVGDLIRAYHLIHTLDDLETATQLVNNLNSSLTTLIATDSFEPMTLVKMSCITIWLVGSATEELQVSAAGMTAAEATAAALATSLAAGAIVSLLLCSHSHTASSLQALKVYLEWVSANPQLLRDASFLSRPQLWPALAHTLNTLAQHTEHFKGHNYDTVPLPEDEELHGFLPLDKMHSGLKFSKYASWETYGDRIPHCEPIAGDAPRAPTPLQSSQRDREGDGTCASGVQVLENDPALAASVRAWRLVHLGRRLVDVLHQHGAHYLQLTNDEETSTFSAPQSSPELVRALEELSLARQASPASPAAAPPHHSEEESDDDDDDDVRAPPPPPVIISEADFREKVREKRVGILKPQGSLERAREERALIAATQDNQSEAESGAASEKVEETPRGGRTRTNVAMQAILRVQEESSKQVKFVTPATTPDSTLDPTDVSSVKESEKTKILQPKAIKSLANLPVGKKTGGILSLKDKSAGYPHLQNPDPEPTKKAEDNDKVKKLDGPSVKQGQGSSQSSQQSSYHPTPYSGKARMEHHHQQQPPPPAGWPALQQQQQSISSVHAPPYSEPPRMSFSHHKNYSMQNMPVNFQNTLYSQQNEGNVPGQGQGQGIRLPVVNPKEIDVRSAALQKQYSRPDLFSDGPKSANQNWQVSGDKKAFLSDLPPRFANQFRQWSGASADQQAKYGAPGSQDKFRDDAFKANNYMYGNNNIQPAVLPGWSKPPLPSENLPQPSYNWWSSDNSSTFNPNYPPPSLSSHPTFYPQSMTGGISNPYQTSNYNQMPSQQPGFASKSNDGTLKSMGSNYMQNALTLSQPQAQSLQNLIKSPNYNAAMSSFGNYNQNVNYDSSMYPQFTSNKLGYQPPPPPPAVKLGEKPLGSYAVQKDSMVDLGHGLGLGSNVNDLHPQSRLTMDLMAGVLNNDNMNLMKSLDPFGMSESNAESGNTYSLFSAGEEPLGTGWGGGGVHLPSHHQHQQSLWSGPGPSPLERLLEQQKQLNKSSGEQQ